MPASRGQRGWVLEGYLGVTIGVSALMVGLSVFTLMNESGESARAAVLHAVIFFAWMLFGGVAWTWRRWGAYGLVASQGIGVLAFLFEGDLLWNCVSIGGCVIGLVAFMGRWDGFASADLPPESPALSQQEIPIPVPPEATANALYGRVCHACGAGLAPQARVCSTCGAQLGCVQCGAEIALTARFCDQCGAQQGEASTSSGQRPLI